MDSIRQYLFSVIGAALICGVLTGFINNKTMSGGLIKLLCGIFVCVCVISPLIDLDLSNIDEYISAFNSEAVSIPMEGQDFGQDAFRQSIKEQTESYILDKAASMKTDLLVEVTLSDEAIPTPSGVVLSGDVSPYVKNAITKCLVDELGIPKEQQIWKQ